MLVDDERASKYDHDLARWAAAQPDLEITHLIVHAPAVRPTSRLAKLAALMRTRGLGFLAGRALFGLVVRAERIVLDRRAIHRGHFAKIPIGELVERKIRIRPQVSKSGFTYRFSNEDVERVRALKLDLLIRCGSGILRGEILCAARLGVISFHHGDNRVNRGGPAGFWEAYFGWPKTGFIIQRLTEELDGGEVLARGAFPTQWLFSLNQAHLFAKANVHLKSILKRIAANGELPEAEPSFPYSGRLYKVPTLEQGLIYCARVGARLAARAARRVSGARQRWGLAFVEKNWRGSVLRRAWSPKLPKGRFWADPFLVERDGKRLCFVEDFGYATGRGHITALEVGKSGVAEIGAALVEPFHLSFPFLFEYAGELYMCPESAQARQIRIYRCTGFPLLWELAVVAMHDVSAADTMLFERDQKWWMLTNIDQSGTGDHCSELYLFFADSPLAASWTPHPQNPILIDPERARNGGLIIEAEKIFRVGQRQGFDRYGAGLSIFEIAELSPQIYREEIVAEILPDFRAGLLGVHHLSTAGSLTVVDQASYGFVGETLLAERLSATLRTAKCAGQSRAVRREESPGFTGQRAG